MNLRSVLISNGTGLFLLLMLLIVSRARVQRKKLEDRVFVIMIAGVMLACLFECLSYFIDEKLFFGARILNYISNIYLYVANSMLTFLVLVYFDLVLYNDPSRIKKNYMPQILVEIVMILANVINIFFPITFYINDQNVYERRPFSYVYLAVIIYFTASAWFTTKKYEKENGIRAFLNVNMFLAPVITGTALQFAFYGLSLGWLASAVGLVCLYMMQQNETAYIDPTSDIYNRQYMNHIISSWTRSNVSMAGMMIDIDRFKMINDIFGHMEGDEVIKSFASLLMDSRTSGELVFRFAGDEFLILKKSDRQDALDDFIKKMNRNLIEYNEIVNKEYILSVSYGTSLYDPKNPDLDRFMRDMDEKMYEMKEENHKKNII